MQIETAKITLEQYFTPEELAFVKEQYNQDKLEYSESVKLMKESQQIPFPEFKVWVKGLVRDKEFGKVNKLSLIETVALRKQWSSLGDKIPASKHFADWLKEYKQEYDALKLAQKPSLVVFIQEKLKKADEESVVKAAVNKPATVKFMQDKTLGVSNKGLVYGAVFLGVLYLGYRMLIKRN